MPNTTRGTDTCRGLERKDRFGGADIEGLGRTQDAVLISKPGSEGWVSEEIPLVFVEVDPSQVVKEAPKNAKYYSSQNARAANPDAKVETEKPKIDGTQTRPFASQ